MLAKSKLIRFALGACLSAACLAVGSGLLQPAQANAAIVRVGPVFHRPAVRVVEPVAPIVTTAPVLTAPVVHVGPVYHPFYEHHGYVHFWHR